MKRLLTLLALLLAGTPPRAAAQDDVATLLQGANLKEASAMLRGLVLQAMPKVLYESAPNWGHTSEVRTIRWKGQGLQVHPETVRVKKNDGTWRKVRVTPRDPARTLVFELHDLQQPAPDRLTFQVFAAMQATVEYEQWLWESGIRLYSGSVRARLRGIMKLHCEVLMRVEPTGSFVPDLVFRLRVPRAECSYDNMVVEHVAGVGGTTARLLGEAVRGGLKQWHPSIERDLLAKANAAVVKAGDAREVRLSLSKLLKLPAK